jgi:hypothetical protein
MHEDHVIDTDVAQAQEQNTDRQQHAKAKTGNALEEHLSSQQSADMKGLSS